jgi:altronate dehydratase
VSGRLALRLQPEDNVATALVPLEPGAVVEAGGREVTVREAIPLCHKLALVDLPAGAAVLKYGQPIGRATAPIAAGGHVHVHNMTSERGQGQSGGG